MEISDQERKLVVAVKGAITEIWAEDNYYQALLESLTPIVAAGLMTLMKWDDQDDRRPVVLATEVDGVTETTWMTTDAMVLHRPYHPRNRYAAANKVEWSHEAAGRSPFKYAVFKELCLEELRLSDQLRALLYDGDRHLAYCGFLSDQPFTQRDKSVFEEILPAVRHQLALRQSMESAPTSEGTIQRVLDASTQPAFILSDQGSVVFANSAAKTTFPTRPAWLKALQENPSLLEGRSVSLVFAGHRLHLIFCGGNELLPTEAHKSPWAVRWRLSPRHAKIAVHIANGLTDRQIADEMELAHSTIRTYVRELFSRAGVHSRRELIEAIR